MRAEILNNSMSVYLAPIAVKKYIYIFQRATNVAITLCYAHRCLIDQLTKEPRTMAVTVCFLLLVVLASSRQAYSTSSKRFTLLYEEGLTAYGAKQWSRAAELFQNAIDQYNQEKEKLFSCVRECRDHKSTDNSLFTRNGELAETELQLVHVSHCIRHCRGASLAQEGVVFDIINTFETRVPYDFLQFSQTQVSNLIGCSVMYFFNYTAKTDL